MAALTFTANLNDAQFQAALARMQSRTATVSSGIVRSLNGATERLRAGFLDVTKDLAKGLSGALGAAGFGVGLDNGIARFVEIYKKTAALNLEAERAPKEAEGMRGTGAEAGFASRIKGIQEYNAELSKTSQLEQAIAAIREQERGGFATRAAAQAQSAEALGKITSDEEKRQQIEIERAKANSRISEDEIKLARDKNEAAARMAKLLEEMRAAKNAQLSGEVGIMDAGKRQAATLSGMIADEEKRRELLEAQASLLRDQRLTVEAVYKARRDVQAKDEADAKNKSKEEADRVAAKRLEENKKSAQGISDAIRQAAEGGAKRLADEMERSRDAATALKQSQAEAFQARVDRVLMSPDESREAIRDETRRHRAEGRVRRDIDRETRDAARRARNGVTTTRHFPSNGMENADLTALSPATIQALAQAFSQAVSALVMK